MYKSIYAERDKAALEGLGVKTGHQVKIIKKIKEYFDKQLAGKHGEETVV